MNNWSLSALRVLFLVLALPASAQTGDDVDDALMARLREPIMGDPLTNDNRTIAVAVAYEPPDFFLEDEHIPRGYEYEMLKQYEQYLNQGVDKESDWVDILFIPLPFDGVLPAILEGRADIAAAGLTVTPERMKLVDFSLPYLTDVSEVVVTNSAVGGITSLKDLSGRWIYVLAGSSYVEHLQELSDALVKAGKMAIKILESEPGLTSGDILQLVNTGVVEITVADDHIAETWAEVLPNLTVHRDVSVHAAGDIAWAVRKDSPQLLASLNDFNQSIRPGSLLGNMFFKRYYEDTRWVQNPLTKEERLKLERVTDLMQRYGEKYHWDWLALAAQGYQESGLDNSVVSPAGAVGIMQILPATAAGDPINIDNIEQLENNIHAGAKYLAWLRDTYFDDPAIDPAARVDFSWASYNAGPNRVRELRRKAAARGYDPDIWFGHVEHIAAEVIGRETVEYVANVNMYYAVYKLAL